MGIDSSATWRRWPVSSPSTLCSVIRPFDLGFYFSLLCFSANVFAYVFTKLSSVSFILARLRDFFLHLTAIISIFSRGIFGVSRVSTGDNVGVHFVPHWPGRYSDRQCLLGAGLLGSLRSIWHMNEEATTHLQAWRSCGPDPCVLCPFISFSGMLTVNVKC